MRQILKFLVKDTLICGAVIGVLYLLGIEKFKIVAIIVAVGFFIQFVMSYMLLIRQVNALYYSIYKIDFNKINDEPIDFTKLDKINPKSGSEIDLITKKFKHLVDILCSRINKLNSAVDKSTHDALSGCFNVGYWNQMKDNYSACSSVCIIFIDVNNLKRMNDVHGHEAGDNLIRVASKHLSWWNGKGDVFRMGGDEFMVVIVNQTLEKCRKLINTWYPTVGRMNPESDDFACVMSYGVAYGKQFCDMEELRKLADDRMYEHKVKIKEKLGEPMR